jgi:hypothetical protein
MRVLSIVNDRKILWLRSGCEHRFTGVWAVVLRDRVFVRSWNDKPTGWYRAFLEEPRGAIRLGDRLIRERARMATSDRVVKAVEKAYADKYRTPASLKYVRGFKLPRRRRTTTELIPA